VGAGSEGGSWDPLLDPESSVTFDAGVDWRPGSTPGVQFSATYFYRVSDRLIDYVLTPAAEISTARSGQIAAGESYFYTRNIADSRTRGVETELSVRRQIAERLYLGVRLGYTYLRTTNEENVVSRYIANHPEHQASLVVDYQWADRVELRSETYLQTRDEERMEALNSEVRGAYVVSNVKATVQVRAGRLAGLRLFSRVYNIGNTQYQEILGAPMPGRWVSAGVELNF
jgi:Outer membrane receptor for ferrienterochelin and colicins